MDPANYKSYVPAIVSFIVVIAIAIGGFVVTQYEFRRAAQAEFNQAAQERVAAIRRVLNENLLSLESMQSMYIATRGNPGPELRAFVEPYESNLEGLQALQWILRVSDEDRDSYEEERRREGITGYQIRERQAPGTMIKAERRAEYYPVVPIPPVDKDEPSIGFDVGSEPIRRQALELARDTGKTIASARVRLVHEQQEGKFGFLAFAPVYDELTIPPTIQERRDSLRGFVIGVYHVGDIVEAAIRVFDPEGLDVTVLDDSAPESERLLYHHGSRTRDGMPVDNEYQQGFMPESFTTSFQVEDRTWSITSTPAPYFMASRKNINSWLILFSGVCFAVLFSLYLVVKTRQAVLLQREITERKNAERALRQVRDELEHRVEERTTELHTAHEKILKQERLSTLGQLTATVSHELRNPLGTIMTSVALLEKKLETLGVDELPVLDRLHRSVIRCDRIISELLDFTRLRAGDKELLELDQCVAEVIAEQVIPEGIDVHSELSSLAVVRVDRELIRRALINVVDNACQSMQEMDGDKRLTLMTEIEEGWCRVLVKDTGVGIPTALMEQVFEPMFSTKTYGVGLGMTIVKQIMKKLGGRVEIVSKEGQGTELSLWFPLVEEATQARLRA